MAEQQLISDIVKQQAYDQITKLQSMLDSLDATLLKLVEDTLKFNQGMGGSGGGNFKPPTAQLSELEKIKRQLIATEEKLAASQTIYAQLLEREKQALKGVTDANKDFVKANNAAEGSIEAMRMELKALQKEYDGMAASERNAARGSTLVTHLKQVDSELKKLEANTGRFQRNVGNYASGFNDMNMAVSQFAREMPNFAQSMQIGIMSLTNNVGAFTDAISQIKAENKVLQSEGKATQSVFKAVGMSLISWNTLIMVAVTAVTAYSDEIQELWKGLNKTDDAQKDLNDSIMEGVKQSQSEVFTLDRLYKKTQDVTESTDDRREAAWKLQQMFPAYFKNITEEAILNGQAATVYDTLRNSIIAVAKAKAIEQKIVEITNNGLEEEAELIKNLQRAQADMVANRGKSGIVERLSGGTGGVATQQGLSAQEMDARRAAAVAGAKNELDVFRATQSEKVKMFSDMLDSLDDLTITHDKKQVAFKESEKKKAKEKEVNRIEDLKKLYEGEQALLELKLYQDEITHNDYYIKLINLNKGYIKEREGLSKEEALSEKKWNAELSKANKDASKEVAEMWEISETLQQGYSKTTKDKKIKDLEEFRDRVNKDVDEANKKGDKEAQDLKRRKEESLSIKLEYIQAMTGLLSDIGDIHERQADLRYNKQLDYIAGIEKAELESLEKRGLTEEQQAVERKRIEIETSAARKKAERERIDELRRAAKFQRALDVAQVISNTALGVTNAYAKGDPYTASVRAFSAAAIGIAQLARIFATPLPEYAKGTDNHKGGLAMVGDGKGKNAGVELVIEPTGKKYLTPSTPTVMDLPARTKVISHEKLMEMVYNQAIVNMANKGGTIGGDNMQEATLKAFEDMSVKVDKLTQVMESKNFSATFYGNTEYIGYVKNSLT